MENQDINFIGKGKQTGNKIQISFDWETLKKLPKHEFEGKKYQYFHSILKSSPILQNNLPLLGSLCPLAFLYLDFLRAHLLPDHSFLSLQF